MNELYKAAEAYRASGLTPIPCEPRGKKALIEWRAYQHEQPSQAQVADWWKRWPDANVALVTGNGMFVLDFDGEHALALLPIILEAEVLAAPCVFTGKGQHRYFRGKARNRAALLKGLECQVDVRGDGGYVLAPPSVHPSGAIYRGDPLSAEEGDVLVVGMSTASPQLMRLLETSTVAIRDEALSGPGWVAKAMRGVPEGARDDTCARLAGYFLHLGMPEDVLRVLLGNFAAGCVPFYPMADVDRVVASIARAEGRKPKPTTSETVVEHVSLPLARLLDQIRRGPLPCVSVPFPSLVYMLDGGFQAGQLILIGARPGVGKTALGLTLARKAARAEAPVLIVSREMVSEALARRMIAQEGRIEASSLRGGKIEFDRLEEVAHDLASLPIFLTDSARTTDEICTALDAMPEACGLLVVDYLQLVQAPAQIRERRLQVEHVSQNLKALALERKIPVVCLSSLSRLQGKEKPSLASFRESGELEHDADVAILLHEIEDQNYVECIVAKNRDGRSGVFKLAFDRATVSMAEMALGEL